MPVYGEYVFILWGDNFEEAVAATFVTELREAGLRVKVVGLAPRREIKGAHGLSLAPDFTLSKALPLAERAICVVLPYAGADIERLKKDPRLVEFLGRACAGGEYFIHGPVNGLDAPGLFDLPRDKALIYPESEDLVEFTRELAGRLRSAEDVD